MDYFKSQKNSSQVPLAATCKICFLLPQFLKYFLCNTQATYHKQPSVAAAMNMSSLSFLVLLAPAALGPYLIHGCVLYSIYYRDLQFVDSNEM